MKDNLAVMCSGLCLVHCVVTPILLGLCVMGVLTSMMASKWVHVLMLIPVITLALLSLPGSYSKHSSALPSLFATAGIFMMATSLFTPEKFELWLMLPAAFLVIWAHLWNRWLLVKLNLRAAVQSHG